MHSYWEKDAFFDHIDVWIIGGGLVGLSTALSLRALAPGLRVGVVERGALPSGASSRNAGFACFGSPTELLHDLAQLGKTAVWDLVAQRYRGLRLLRERIGEAALRYEACGGYELFRPEEQAAYQACQAALPTFNAEMRRITGQAEVFYDAAAKLSHQGLGQVAHLIGSRVEGVLHPGYMMQALAVQAQAAGVRLLYGLPVAGIETHSDGVYLQLEMGAELRGEQVVVATNGFAQRLLPELPLRPARNQVLLTAPVPGLKLHGCFHYREGYVYFRHAGDRVLIGGARDLNPAGETTADFGETPQIQAALEDLLREVVLPGQPFTIEHRWSGILGVGEEKRPIVQRMGPRLVVAVRLSGMGVAIGSLLGEQAARLVAQI